jgi:hypothetical protein
MLHARCAGAAQSLRRGAHCGVSAMRIGPKPQSRQRLAFEACQHWLRSTFRRFFRRWGWTF